MRTYADKCLVNILQKTVANAAMYSLNFPQFLVYGL